MNRFSGAVVGLLLFACSAPALAVDPFTLFLLRMLRDQAISSTLESGASSSQQAPKLESAFVTRPVQPSSDEGGWLKKLIDESFVHLSAQQREELYASLNKMLNDPKNAEVRSTILSEFSAQAMVAREAHRQLSSMSDADMRRVTAAARTEFERLPPDQRKQLIQALQQGVPGMPQSLHDMILTEFGSVPPR